MNFIGQSIAIILTSFLITYVLFKETQLLDRILVAAGPAIVAIVIAFVFRNKFTVFEFLFVNVVLSTFCALICVKFFNKKIDTDTILQGAFICSAATCFYSILTQGQTLIHSDTATASMLAQAEWKYKEFFPRSWAYVNGDIWILSSNVATMPFTLLMKDQPLARMFGSVIMVLTAVLALKLQSEKLFDNKSWYITASTFTLLIFGSYSWTLYEAAYTSLMMWIAIFSWLGYEMIKSRDKKIFIAFIICAILTVSTGIRFLAEIILPLLLATVITVLLPVYLEEADRKQAYKTVLLHCLVILVPTVIGMAVYKSLVSNHIMINTVNNSTVFTATLEECWQNLNIMILNIFENFGYIGSAQLVSGDGIRNLCSLVITLLFFFIFPALQLRTITKENDKVKFFNLFAFIHNLEMVALAILFSKTEARYFLTSVYINIIVSGVYVYNHLLSKANFKYVLTFLYSFVLAFFAFCLVLDSRGWQARLRDNKEYPEQLVSKGVTKLYAPYWEAYKYEIYSDMELECVSLGIGDSIPPENRYAWLVDTNRFGPSFASGEGRSCIALNNEQNEFAYGNMIALYGTPAETLMLDGKHVYIWDYDIAEKLMDK